MAASPSVSPPLISLKNGEKVKVNDHVYCSPDWTIRDGTPYSVARIMEFLPAQGISTFDENGKRNEPITRVRLAWYYRPSDVSDRPVADSRLLLAAIYSEVCDLNQLRSKCHVMHRDKISDLSGWKKRPDRFYFTRLFDPWIRKEFEVIQATTVQNVPQNIRDVLVSRYEYVVAEKEVVPDLTDTLRLCDTCEKWCPPSDTVQCDRCKKFFHMGCVNPPLAAKPSRGYGWTCAPCSRKHEEEVDSHEVRHPTPVAPKPKSNAPPPRGRGRPRKDRGLQDREENMAIKHFKMWPFRYFGQYTVAEDTLDEDDLIFPRAATRVGPKYQANVPTLIGLPELEERGSDDTIEVMSFANKMSPDEVATLEAHRDKIAENVTQKADVDWLTELFFRFTDAWQAKRELTSVSMASPLRLKKWGKSETSYCDKEWNRMEVAAFEDAIATYGAELRPVREEVGTRSMPEVVRFYGHWKNSKLGEENARIKAARLSGKEIVPLPSRAASPSSPDEGSIVKQLTKGNSSCGACRTRESNTWWKAPKGLVTNVLCDNCGIGWRKYADLNVRPVREETLTKSKPGDKREGTPLNGPITKRAKTTSSVQSTPPPSSAAPAAPQLRCYACQKSGPVGKVLRCRQCQFRVHAGVCGVVVDSTIVESWICELCQNEKTLEASLNTDCMLCPRIRRDPKKKTLYPPPDTFLRACKPTEGQAWVHVLCSVFVPEVMYSDASRLRLVEGINTISPHRWSTKCTICDHEGGAVIRCSDCALEFHVSCAWKHGYKFGFEVQQVRNSRREATTVVDFNEESGCMVPIVHCKSHSSKRHMYEICDTNELGETALQIYCRNYKQVQVAQTHGLLRKALRLDKIIDLTRPPEDDPMDGIETEQNSVDPECVHCHTTFSPFFHPVAAANGKSASTPTTSGTWLCHRCHFEKREGHSETNGMMSP